MDAGVAQRLSVEPIAVQNDSRLQFVCPPHCQVKLPATGLKIILSGLLDNALKYSGRGGRVELEVKDHAEGIEIRVQDDGPGIVPEERQKIFEKFYRGSGGQENIQGSGLGLNMARTLAQAMGGHLELVDQPPPGCCFLLTFSGSGCSPSSAN